MKKLLKVFLSLGLILALTACTNNTTNNETKNEAEEGFKEQVFENDLVKVTITDLSIFTDEDKYYENFVGYIQANVIIENKSNNLINVARYDVSANSTVEGYYPLGSDVSEPLYVNEDGTGTFSHFTIYSAGINDYGQLECNLTIPKDLMEQSTYNYPIHEENITAIDADDTDMKVQLSDIALTLENDKVTKIDCTCTITNRNDITLSVGPKLTQDVYGVYSIPKLKENYSYSMHNDTDKSFYYQYNSNGITKITFCTVNPDTFADNHNVTLYTINLSYQHDTIVCSSTIDIIEMEHFSWMDMSSEYNTYIQEE